MLSKKTVTLGLCTFFTVMSAAFANDLVMFNYQGRVRVQGTAFNGTGYFKFAIVNNAGNVTLWSNDGTSVGGGEPVASIAVDVVEGIFNVMIGDPALDMEPMNRSIFNHPSQIKLRIWFSDGSHGFQRLLPDRRIVNPELMGLRTGTRDFTIYVNGTTGNDDNNGLTTDTAKLTIQGAVDVLPERLRCNVTIDIANGVYREEVKVFGIFVEPGKTLTFLGDESWTPSSPGDPAVRITGNDNDTTATKVRANAFWAQQCSNITLKGILFDYTSGRGLYLREGSYTVYNCKSTHNTTGFAVTFNANAAFVDCVAYANDENGFDSWRNTTVGLTNCVARDNGWSGVVLNILASGQFADTGDFSNNGYTSGPSGSTHNGITVNNNSRASFVGSYSGQIHDNAEYGIQIRYDSFTEDHTKNSFSGNGLGDLLVNNGGHTYF
jgi:hypothetical protein